MSKLGRLIRAFAKVVLLGFLLLGFLLVPGLPDRTYAQSAVQDLVSIPRFEIPPVGPYELHKIDRKTGETLSTLILKIPDIEDCENFRNANGLALDPLTEQLFTTLSCGFFTPRFLATIDTATGAVSVVGNTGDFFASLAFTPDGSLIGVTGNGGNIPNTLFVISTQDASATPICKLPDNPEFGGGQTIAFNPEKGLLFQASGNARFGGTRVFTSINNLTPTDPLAECDRTVRGPSGEDYDEATAMAFSGDSFLLAGGVSGSSNLYSITEDGVATLRGPMDHVSKGLAFISAPAEVCYKIKKTEGESGPDDAVIEDLIVGKRPARLKNKPYIVCVPGGIQFVRDPE